MLTICLSKRHIDEFLFLSVLFLPAALIPHLSLWAQCTLPKAVFKVYGQDQTGRDLLVTAVVEDSNTSVDIQEIYSKIKVKIGTFEVKHFVRSDSSRPWGAGPFLGTVRESVDRYSIISFRYKIGFVRSFVIALVILKFFYAPLTPVRWPGNVWSKISETDIKCIA